MSNKNAYFQLQSRSDGTYLLLYPGSEQNKLVFREIDEYLRVKQIEYDKENLMRAVSNFVGGTSIKLTGKPHAKEKEYLYVINNLNYIYTNEVDFAHWRTIILNSVRGLSNLHGSYSGE